MNNLLRDAKDLAAMVVFVCTDFRCLVGITFMVLFAVIFGPTVYEVAFNG